MSHSYQVIKHTFHMSTRKVESQKVGKPAKRTVAQSLCDKLNDRSEIVSEDAGTMISYTCQLVKTAAQATV